MLYIGIDLGGTDIKAGIVDKEGYIISQAKRPTSAKRHYSEVIKDMADCAKEALDSVHYDLDDIASVGIGIPGIGDNEKGKVIFCTNLSWYDVPLREEMQKYIDKPVFIGNDATVAGFAEYIAGVSKGTHSSVFITLGTGVGSGIIINGKPWSGFHGVGSELGHITLERNGILCSCGNKGCLERYCSATAVIRMGREELKVNPDSLMMKNCNNNPENLDAKNVFDAAKANDVSALKVFDEYVENLCMAVNTVIGFLDPEVIVLGGGVSKAGTYLTDAINKRIGKYLLFKTCGYSKIQLAELGAGAGMIGAAMLGAY